MQHGLALLCESQRNFFPYEAWFSFMGGLLDILLSIGANVSASTESSWTGISECWWAPWAWCTLEMIPSLCSEACVRKNPFFQYCDRVNCWPAFLWLRVEAPESCSSSWTMSFLCEIFALRGVLSCVDLGSLKANSNLVLLLQIPWLISVSAV